jgi:hypothetical protein
MTMATNGSQPDNHPSKRPWNPLRADGRSRGSSQEAQASICMIRARIELIRAREGLVEHEDNGQDTRVSTQSEPPGQATSQRFMRTTIKQAAKHRFWPASLADLRVSVENYAD